MRLVINPADRESVDDLIATSRNAKAKPRAKRLMSAPDEATPHILIVDDDTRIRELLKKYLSDNGIAQARRPMPRKRRKKWAR